MFNFLKNHKKIIVFDIGSQKIGAICFKISNNRPMIIDMEYQKNNQDENKSHSLSDNIRKIYKKISNNKDKYLIYCNITGKRSFRKARVNLALLQILRVNPGLSPFFSRQ